MQTCPVGLTALLTQEGKIIAYSSRALTDVESRYSQTEKEALAIVWAIEHFHLYLYGHSLELISDHLPLETIFNNPKTKTPAKNREMEVTVTTIQFKYLTTLRQKHQPIIERWRLRLQQYNLNI